MVSAGVQIGCVWATPICFFLGTRQLGVGVVCGCLLRREQALPIGTVTRMVSAGVQIGCVWATPICFLGTRQLGLGVVCGCLLRREQTLPIGTVTRMVSAGVQIGCVWATPICFFGNQTIGSGCNMWLAAQEGAGSPRGENLHISSASGGSGPIYAPGGVGEVTMGRPLGVGAGQGSRGDHEWLKRLSLDRNWFAREAVIHVDVRT